MNKKQKKTLINIITIFSVTIIAVVGMINAKDWVNRAEAMRAMEQLGQRVLKYREDNKAVPPESYVDTIKERLEGYVRLGKLQYRARWIDLDSTSEEILAFTPKNYSSSFLGKGYIVLRLDGSVQWIKSKEFEPLLRSYQSDMEIKLLQMESK
jgi:hypothetical protein